MDSFNRLRKVKKFDQCYYKSKEGDSKGACHRLSAVPACVKPLRRRQAISWLTMAYNSGDSYVPTLRPFDKLREAQESGLGMTVSYFWGESENIEGIGNPIFRVSPFRAGVKPWKYTLLQFSDESSIRNYSGNRKETNGSLTQIGGHIGPGHIEYPTPPFCFG